MGLLEQHADKWEPEPMSGCFLWTGALHKRPGYETPKVGVSTKPHTVFITRAVLLENKGPPPTDRHQCSHKCNNRICVNPDHLVWETSKENNNRMSPQHRRHVGTAKGFYFHKGDEVYMAFIRPTGSRKKKYLGRFNTPEAASEAYQTALKEYV